MGYNGTKGSNYRLHRYSLTGLVVFGETSMFDVLTGMERRSIGTVIYNLTTLQKLHETMIKHLTSNVLCGRV